MRSFRFVAVVCALAVLVPVGIPAGAQTAGPRQQLDRLEQRIDRARELVEEAERERRGILADLSTSDARRRELSDRIERLTGELGDAEARLAVLQVSLRRTREELDRWTGRLERTRRRLSGQRDALGSRAAAAYRLGPAGFLDLVLGAEDLRSLSDRVEFVSSVLDSDSYLLQTIQTTRFQVGQHRARIARFEGELSAERDRVQREVDRIAQLRAEQQALRADVDQEIATRTELLEDIEATKAGYVRAVKEMEAESARIEALIRGGAGSSGSGNPNAQLAWPAPGPITSGFGWRVHPIFGTQRFHSGVDIDAPCGAPISAAETGTVISSGWNGGYGETIVIDHGDGLSTLYAHQSSREAGAGQRVSRGQRIGAVGTTGWSTGCHLHFEVRVNGTPVDPVPYLT